jgi:hypothetical protein
MSDSVVQTKLEVAKELIKAAEDQLRTALGELEVRPRAEKTTASKVIEEAFARLHEAREQLLSLELADRSRAGDG